MKFIEAMKELENGKKVCRNFWMKGSYLIPDASQIIDISDGHQLSLYAFSIGDFNAEDWEILEMETKCIKEN